MPATTERITIADLADLFRRAKAAALAEANVRDGGTCNFDSPAFRVEGLRMKSIQEAAAKADVSVTDFKWFGKKWLWLNVPLAGQGFRRTAMAEAAHRVLAEDPRVTAHMYYQMD